MVPILLGAVPAHAFKLECRSEYASLKKGPSGPRYVPDFSDPRSRHFKPDDPTKSLAQNINQARLDRKTGKSEFGAPRIKYIIREVGAMAPKGGWKVRQDFIDATDFLFGDSAEGRAEQQEAWEVYQKVLTDPRVPLIATYETFQRMGITRDSVLGIPAVNGVSAALDGPQETRNQDAVRIAQNYQWLYSDRWTPVVNDFYVLGVIHGHDNFHYIPNGNPKVERGLAMRWIPETGVKVPSTTAYELAQLEDYFENGRGFGNFRRKGSVTVGPRASSDPQ